MSSRPRSCLLLALAGCLSCSDDAAPGSDRGNNHRDAAIPVDHGSDTPLTVPEGGTPDGAQPADGPTSTSGWVTIKAGKFTMGSPETEACRGGDDQHEVTLTHSFEIWSTETTQGEYQAEMGYNPSTFYSCGNDCPVDTLTWHMAAAYCNALSKKKGLAACYSCTGKDLLIECEDAKAYAGAEIYKCPGYRLPTEAEWEYAARAGTQTALPGGDLDGDLCKTCSASDGNVGKIGWYCANSGDVTHVVGKKQRNAWGLYDTAGNVAEWCHDLWQDKLGTEAVTDPFGDTNFLADRVLRGGSYYNYSMSLRSAARTSRRPTDHVSTTGVRCVRSL